MHLFSLVSGLLLVFAVRAWAKPQQSADTLLWNGQQDFSNVPSNLIPAELTSQGAVLPADSNVMLVRRPNGARRKPIRLRQQQVAELNRQIKLEGNETMNKELTNSTAGGASEIAKTKQLPPRVNNLLGPDGNQLIRTGVALLGAALGHEGCDLKAACLAATLIPPMQGRDVIVLAAEAIVPEGWRKVYDAAKKRIIHQQDCDRFTCL